ncbi:hypothetical protein [Dolichospermum sp. UHCC 0299]|uniref:hypothetical protein n=1 Tax=Dolichospermum sp. UHCC 0299 TaxID=2590014 RepID=UPI000A050B00|nr:hypothetical protein [Dolichospermum sp. UHCC 0299]
MGVFAINKKPPPLRDSVLTDNLPVTSSLLIWCTGYLKNQRSPQKEALAVGIAKLKTPTLLFIN